MECTFCGDSHSVSAGPFQMTAVPQHWSCDLKAILMLFAPVQMTDLKFLFSDWTLLCVGLLRCTNFKTETQES
jgi:hypothetical protein